MIIKKENSWRIRIVVSSDVEAIRIDTSPNRNEILVPPIIIIIGVIGHMDNIGIGMIAILDLVDLDSIEITVVLAGSKVGTEIIEAHNTRA